MSSQTKAPHVGAESAASATARVGFTLNGKNVGAEVRPDESALEMLRERFDLISAKNGCEPMGSCGCCLVLVDGKPRLTCTVKATTLEGRHVETLEGLSQGARKEIAECFVHAGAVQCGFCIPGIAMRAHAMCAPGVHHSRDEIEKELRAHLCRCTGYKKIVDAVEMLEHVRNGAPPPVDGCRGGVGDRLARVGGRETALGDKRYIDDIKVPGMVYAAPRLSDHPRALVRRIDARPALAIEGVLRVVTAADVPGKRHVGLITPDWPVFVAEGEETRYVGDVIAFVVARDMATARRGADAIAVDYEVRRPISTTDDALRPDAPKIHPGGNLLSKSALARGDVEAELSRSAHVVEGTWQTQSIEHLFLEPEACIAWPASGGVHEGSWEQGIGKSVQNSGVALRVLTQGQGIFDDRRQIASVLGWSAEKIGIELVSCGGAFGGKEDLSIQAQTAICAVLVGKPVKCVLTRAQSIRLHPKRHPVRISLRVGSDAEGRLTAVRARIVGDKGAYASVGAKVLERSAGHAIGPYKCANIDIEALAVYTNNPPNGAMRGFGVNQTAFAIEGALDMLAERVGIDGWEMRWRNILRLGDRFCTGQKLTKPFGLEKTLLAVRDAYRGSKFAGIACGIKNVGIGNGLPEVGRASLTVEPDGHITLRTGHTEMGQGLFTVAIQTAVEETGLPHEIFNAACDSSDALDSGQTTGSRGTVLTCHAVIDACQKLYRDLEAMGITSSELRVKSDECKGQGNGQSSNSLLLTRNSLLPLAGRKYLGEWTCYPTDKFGAKVEDPKTHLTYGFATQVCILNEDGSIRRMVAAHDVGRAINPTLLEGQLEGSIHMGLGYALTEEFRCEDGRIVTADVKSCGVLRAHQMPEIEMILIEEPDAECPYGARGVAEIGLVPTAPAVAGAMYKFDGVRRFTLPMKDSPAAKATRGGR